MVMILSITFVPKTEFFIKKNYILRMLYVKLNVFATKNNNNNIRKWIVFLNYGFMKDLPDRAAAR